MHLQMQGGLCGRGRLSVTVVFCHEMLLSGLINLTAVTDSQHQDDQLSVLYYNVIQSDESVNDLLK